MNDMSHVAKQISKNLIRFTHPFENKPEELSAI